MLHELVKCDVDSEPGFSVKEIKWLLLFSLDGKFIDVHPTDDNPKSKGREFKRCPDLTDIELKSVLDGERRRHFLVDDLEAVACYSKTGQVDEKLAIKHGYFVDLLEQGGDAMPVLQTIANAIRDVDVRATIHASLSNNKAKHTDKATFAVMFDESTTSTLVEKDDWRDWWRGFRENLVTRLKAKSKATGKKKTTSPGEPKYLCFLTGEPVEASQSFVVKGLASVGGQPSGDRLICFDKDAFTSYGLPKHANATIGEEMAKRYVAVLNDLLRHHSKPLAGVKVLYWYSGPVEEKEDVILPLFGGPTPELPDDAEEDDTSEADKKAVKAQAETAARRFLDGIREGKSRAKELADYRYFALTLSANSGRVVIRDWMEGPFKELATAIDQWFSDLSITNLSGVDVTKPPRLENLVTCLLGERRRSQKYEDWVKPVGDVRGNFWQCALGGRMRRIPPTAASRVLRQHCAAMINGELHAISDPSDQSVGIRITRLYSRVSILKAFLVRKGYGDNDMLTHFNEDLDHPCYQFGRLVAVLADLQRVALRKESGETVKASIVERFYATASSAPRQVHARLVSLSNHHLRKLNQQGNRGTRAANAIRDRIADISIRIDPLALPHAMTLAEQSFFALGYYHQVAQMNCRRREAAAKSVGDGE